MKIYFSATITSNDKLREIYKRVKEVLTKEGHSVFDYGSDNLEPSQLAQRSDTEIQSTYKQLDKYLKNAEVYIADISEPSVGIGYEISQALMLRKPCLVLKYQKAGFQPLATIQGNNSAYMKYKTYDERTLESIIKKFIGNSKDKIDTKFILIIPPEIDRYLEWNVREKGVTKAEITREAIEMVMRQDQRYQEYLQSEFAPVEEDEEVTE
jgi:uncharacterized protein (DUF302 family)